MDAFAGTALKMKMIEIYNLIIDHFLIIYFSNDLLNIINFNKPLQQSTQLRKYLIKNDRTYTECTNRKTLLSYF